MSNIKHRYNPIDLEQRVKESNESREVTFSEWRDLLGVKSRQTAYNQLTNQGINKKLKVLCTIAERLDISPQELMGWEIENESTSTDNVMVAIHGKEVVNISSDDHIVVIVNDVVVWESSTVEEWQEIVDNEDIGNDANYNRHGRSEEYIPPSDPVPESAIPF